MTIKVPQNMRGDPMTRSTPPREGLDDAGLHGVPEQGFLKRKDGRHGPIFPGVPASYGFTIIATGYPGKRAGL
jgi:hypothetical protein